MVLRRCWGALVVRKICTLLGDVNTGKGVLTRFGLDYGMWRQLALYANDGNLHS